MLVSNLLLVVVVVLIGLSLTNQLVIYRISDGILVVFEIYNGLVLYSPLEAWFGMMSE